MADCIFCKIAAGQIPSKTVFTDDDVVAFHDITPQAPVHVLVVPRRHVATFHDAAAEPGGPDLLGKVMAGARRAADTLGLSRDNSYRVVINCGEGAGQSVWHLHAHVLGGRPLGWPPG